VARILLAFSVIRGEGFGPRHRGDHNNENQRVRYCTAAPRPIVAASLAGYGEVAKYVGIGAVLAMLLGLLARPVAAFAVLLPVVYAAAALTGQSTTASSP